MGVLLQPLESPKLESPKSRHPPAPLATHIPKQCRNEALHLNSHLGVRASGSLTSKLQPRLRKEVAILEQRPSQPLNQPLSRRSCYSNAPSSSSQVWESCNLNTSFFCMPCPGLYCNWGLIDPKELNHYTFFLGWYDLSSIELKVYTFWCF